MATTTYVITDPEGIHARPAGIITKAAKEINGGITIEKNGKVADARKMFAVMGLGVKNGDTITVSADTDENLAKFLDVLRANV